MVRLFIFQQIRRMKPDIRPDTGYTTPILQNMYNPAQPWKRQLHNILSAVKSWQAPGMDKSKNLKKKTGMYIMSTTSFFKIRKVLKEDCPTFSSKFYKNSNFTVLKSKNIAALNFERKRSQIAILFATKKFPRS